MADDLEMARAIRETLSARSPLEAGRASAKAEILTAPGAAAAVCMAEWRKLTAAESADPRIEAASDILYRAAQSLQDIARAMVNDLEDAALAHRARTGAEADPG